MPRRARREARDDGARPHARGQAQQGAEEARPVALKAKARDAVQGGGAGETKWQRKQRPRLQRWLDSAVIVVRDCKRAERYATQPFGAGDAEDIARDIAILHKSMRRRREDYFKCFLLQGAVYRGLDADRRAIIDVKKLLDRGGRPASGDDQAPPVPPLRIARATAF